MIVLSAGSLFVNKGWLPSASDSRQWSTGDGGRCCPCRVGHWTYIWYILISDPESYDQKWKAGIHSSLWRLWRKSQYLTPCAVLPRLLTLHAANKDLKWLPSSCFKSAASSLESNSTGVDDDVKISIQSFCHFQLVVSLPVMAWNAKTVFANLSFNRLLDGEALGYFFGTSSEPQFLAAKLVIVCGTKNSHISILRLDHYPFASRWHVMNKSGVNFFMVRIHCFQEIVVDFKH